MPTASDAPKSASLSRAVIVAPAGRSFGGP
jgi:hypothetical protein